MWDATFHTAPRNVVPGRKADPSATGVRGVRGKLLGKAMSFVSDVLFTKNTPASSQGGVGGTGRAEGRKQAREGNLGSTDALVPGQTMSVLERSEGEVQKDPEGDAQGLENFRGSPYSFVLDFSPPTLDTRYLPRPSPSRQRGGITTWMTCSIFTDARRHFDVLRPGTTN